MGRKQQSDREELEQAMAEALESVEREEREQDGTPESGMPSDEPAGEEGPSAIVPPPEEVSLHPSSEGRAPQAQDLEEVQRQEGAEAKKALDPEQTQVLKDQLLRLAADFENFRKRVQREKEDTRKYGIEPVMRDLLPVVDNFDRALAHAPEGNDPLATGLRMVHKQLLDALAVHGVKGFPSEGRAFNPEVHEAVGQLPSDAHPPGSVMNEVQAGYMLHDRLLRPAQVVVALAVDAAADGADVNGAGAGIDAGGSDADVTAQGGEEGGVVVDDTEPPATDGEGSPAQS